MHVSNSSHNHWRPEHAVVLALLLAACRACLTSAAAVTHDSTLKFAGSDPGIPPDILTEIHGEQDRVLGSASSNVLMENERGGSDTEATGDNLNVLMESEIEGSDSEATGDITNLEGEVVLANDAEENYAIGKPVSQTHRLSSSGFLSSRQSDKLQQILLRRRKKTAKQINQTKNDITSENTRNSPSENTRNSPSENTRNSPSENTRNSASENIRNSASENTRNSPSENNRNIASENSNIASENNRNIASENISNIASESSRNSGRSDARQKASISGGAGASSGATVAPRRASYEQRGAALHTGAALAISGPELSSSDSGVLQIDSGEPIINVPRVLDDLEISPRSEDLTSDDDDFPSTSVVSDTEVRSSFERKYKLSSETPSVLSKKTTKLGKKKLSGLRRKNVFGGDVGAFNAPKYERNQYVSLTAKPYLTRPSNTSHQRSYSVPFATISSGIPTHSNDQFHLKDASLPDDASRGSGESDAEVEANIVKRSVPGIQDTDSNLPDEQGPTGHVMHRGIMENFAGDFTRNPVDFEFSDDYFNHEPYHYDIYYDDSMNSDFPTDDDLNVEEIAHPGLTSDKLVRTVPWEDEMGSNDATENLGDDLEDVENTLELRLLGPDFQSELGYVLERLANDTQQRNRRHQVPVRHHDPRYSEGISVGVAEGTCPPAVHSLPPGLCQAPPCTSHMMCYPQKMCCFNGCTYTCTEPVQPPPVVDWLEDSDIRLPILDPLNPALPLRFESSPLSYGTGGEETVRLPGGCSLSATKYEELKQFMTAESIQDCLCSGGEVVCVVKSSPTD